MIIGIRVQATEVDSKDKLFWPYAGLDGIEVLPGQLGTVVGHTDNFPIVLFDDTSEPVQIRHNQIERINESQES